MALGLAAACCPLASGTPVIDSFSPSGTRRFSSSGALKIIANFPGSGLSPTNCDPTNLAIVPGFNPTTTATGTKVSFPSSAALISLVSDAAGKASPAAFLIRAAGDTTGSSTFVRFASDNHTSLTQRPQLSIHYRRQKPPASPLARHPRRSWVSPRI